MQHGRCASQQLQPTVGRSYPQLIGCKRLSLLSSASSGQLDAIRAIEPLSRTHKQQEGTLLVVPRWRYQLCRCGSPSRAPARKPRFHPNRHGTGLACGPASFTPDNSSGNRFTALFRHHMSRTSPGSHHRPPSVFKRRTTRCTPCRPAAGHRKNRPKRTSPPPCSQRQGAIPPVWREDLARAFPAVLRTGT